MGKTVILPLFILLCIFRQKIITVFPLEIFTFGLLCNLSTIIVRTGSHQSPTCINHSYTYALNVQTNLYRLRAAKQQ